MRPHEAEGALSSPSSPPSPLDRDEREGGDELEADALATETPPPAQVATDEPELSTAPGDAGRLAPSEEQRVALDLGGEDARSMVEAASEPPPPVELRESYAIVPASEPVTEPPSAVSEPIVGAMGDDDDAGEAIAASATPPPVSAASGVPGAPKKKKKKKSKDGSAAKPKGEPKRADETPLAGGVEARPGEKHDHPHDRHEPLEPLERARKAAPQAEPRAAGARDASEHERDDHEHARAHEAGEAHAPHAPHDHELDGADESSVSSQFFRSPQDSLAPQERRSHDEVEIEHARVLLSPETIARRERFRRIVAGVVAVCGIAAIAVVGKIVVGNKPKPAAPMVQELPQPAGKPEPKKDEPKVVASAEPKVVASAEPSAVASAEPKVDEKKDDKKPEEPTLGEPAKEPAKVDPAEAKKLLRKAESLLNQYKNKDAIEAAQVAIAADPDEAMGYLLWGGALQNMGKGKEAIEIFSECVRKAKKGPVFDCRANGGKK